MKACLCVCGDPRLTLFQLTKLASFAGFKADKEEVYLLSIPGGAASTAAQDRSYMQLFCSFPGVTTLLLVTHDDCKAYPHPELRHEGLMENIKWARQHLPSVKVRAFIVDPHTMTFSELGIE